MYRKSTFTSWAGRYLLCAFALWFVWIVWSARIDVEDPSAVRRAMDTFGMIVVAAVGLCAWVLWYPLQLRIRRLREQVTDYAEGDFSSQLPSDSGTELDALSTDLNGMAQQFHLRSVLAEARKQEQEAVLSSMEEGVVAVDRDRNFININRAAREMLNIDAADCHGHPVSEFIRQPELQQFIVEAVAARDPRRSDVVLQGRTRRQVRVSSMALKDAAEQRMGTLIILTDVTRVRHLERMRTDFVANVSHELKTPITGIKGFIETLQDGAIHEPEEAKRFLEIVARQADRLDAIIEDLLSLSRIEQESERGALATTLTPLAEPVQAAVTASAARAQAAGVRVEVSCPADLQAPVNAPLLEQAVTNLIDNAIKYGGEGKAVTVRVGLEGDRVFVAVTDEGPGIPEKEHERIFQRFYRVDKSRSRRMGGTGLGLSIVKHIAQAHGGLVAVQSAPGQGSTFTLRLPAIAARKQPVV